MSSFPKTKTYLKDFTNELGCVKCSKLPLEKVYVLGQCFHKYCEECIELFKGKKCHSCKVLSETKEMTVDLFTTNLLCELRNFEKELNEENGNTNKQSRSTIEANENSMLNIIEIPPQPQPPQPKEPEITITTRAKRGRRTSIQSDQVSVSTTGTGEERASVKSIEIEKPQLGKRSRPRAKSTSRFDKKDDDVSLNGSIVSSTSIAKVTRKSFARKAQKNPETIEKYGEKGPELELETPKTKSISKSSKLSIKSTDNESKKFETPEALKKIDLVTPARSSRRSLVMDESILETPGSTRSSKSNSSFQSHSEKSINKRNAKGETQLHTAARLGKLDKVKELINAGVDVNVTDHAGYIPLMDAISSNVLENIYPIVKELILADSNVNLPGGLEDQTALHESARLGYLDVTTLLLENKASTRIRNKFGQLAREVAKSNDILQIIDEYTSKCSVSSISSSSQSQPLDEAVLDLIVLRMLVHFTFEDKALIKSYSEKCSTLLNAKISNEFKKDVSHLVFQVNPLNNMIKMSSIVYLSGILNGCWLLNLKWVEESITAGKFLEPTKYIISGTETTKDKRKESNLKDVYKRARSNKEHRNPSLFHGFNFYLYKSCNFSEEIKKTDLINLIKLGDGQVLNREPSPDAIEPLESPTRFHTEVGEKQQPKLNFTSHIVLFDKLNQPPNKHNLEHIKSLRVDWLVDSIQNFQLADPDVYLVYK